MQASTTPVAMKASLSSPAPRRKALRNAPWFPDRPPKNPLRSPPAGSHAGGMRRPRPFRNSSRAKKIMSKPTVSFTGVMKNVLAPEYIGKPRHQAGQPHQQPRSGKTARQGGHSEVQHHGPVRLAAEKREFEQVIGEVHHCGHGHGGFHREKSPSPA